MRPLKGQRQDLDVVDRDEAACAVELERRDVAGFCLNGQSDGPGGGSCLADGANERPRHPAPPRAGYDVQIPELLLGRRTYQEFAPSWSTRTAAEDPGAPFMNGAPKFVVSATLQTADWNNSTILGSYSADTIRELKDRLDGNIYVSGSGTLVRAMLADGLIDELHLFVYPLAHGTGQRLFSDGGPEIKLALTGSEAYSNGVLHLTYMPASSGLG